MTESTDHSVNLITLLALNDEGASSYDRQSAEFLVALSIPVFAFTRDFFPEMMANTLSY